MRVVFLSHVRKEHLSLTFAQVMDIKEQEILGNDAASHWYYRSKVKALLRYLEFEQFRCILDVGAGSGFFSKQLLHETTATEAVCVDSNYVREWDIEENGGQMRYRRACGQVDADLVLLMDVLEHVDDDVGLLREYARKVPSGSRFVLTVPAFQFLWSAHDVFLEHKRRYTLSQLEAVVERAGLQSVRSSYFFALVFPIAVIVRLVERLSTESTRVPKSGLRRHSRFVNRMLGALCMAELPLLRVNRLIGLSVFCLCIKA